MRPFSCSTMKSYPDDSPQGLASGSPSRIARSANTASAHSPRFLQFLIFIPAFEFFFIRLLKFLSKTLCHPGARFCAEGPLHSQPSPLRLQEVHAATIAQRSYQRSAQ